MSTWAEDRAEAAEAWLDQQVDALEDQRTVTDNGAADRAEDREYRWMNR